MINSVVNTILLSRNMWEVKIEEALSNILILMTVAQWLKSTQ